MSESEYEVTSPSYQQELVLESLRSLFNATIQASLEHDKRAEKIAAVAGGIVAFVGGASALPGGDLANTPAAAIALVSVFVVAIVIFYECAKIWAPAETKYPTLTDPQKLYTNYISQGVYEAFNQHLISLANCTESNRQDSNKKADRIDSAVKLVQFQVLSVAIMIICKVMAV